MSPNLFFSRKRRRTATRKCSAAVRASISPLTTSRQNEAVSCWLATLSKTQVRDWFNINPYIHLFHSCNCCMFIKVDHSNHFLTVNYSGSVGNGPVHQTSVGSSLSPLNVESVLPRPFRLESLGVPPAHVKVKRKKSKTLISTESNWQIPLMRAKTFVSVVNSNVDI